MIQQWKMNQYNAKLIPKSKRNCGQYFIPYQEKNNLLKRKSKFLYTEVLITSLNSMVKGKYVVCTTIPRKNLTNPGAIYIKLPKVIEKRITAYLEIIDA